MAAGLTLKFLKIYALLRLRRRVIKLYTQSAKKVFFTILPVIS